MQEFSKVMFYADTKLVLLFVVSESDVLSSVVPFLYTFLFSIPLRSKVYTVSSLRSSRCWGKVGGRGSGNGEVGMGPAAVQLQVPCAGCWQPSSFAKARAE